MVRQAAEKKPKAYTSPDLSSGRPTSLRSQIGNLHPILQSETLRALYFVSRAIADPNPALADRTPDMIFFDKYPLDLQLIVTARSLAALEDDLANGTIEQQMRIPGMRAAQAEIILRATDPTIDNETERIPNIIWYRDQEMQAQAVAARERLEASARKRRAERILELKQKFG